MSDTLPVIEIFGPTIQGEGILAGVATHFVRLGLCDYRCLAADTMVLLPNLRERAISELAPGDAILGYARKARNGPYRLTPTTVVRTRELPPEPTVIVTFDDGSSITGSPDHRLWREFVRGGNVWTSALGNYAEMADLVEGSIVKGPGAALHVLPRTLAWKRGYVAGAMDGDGHVGATTIAFKVTSRSFFDTALEASEAVGAPLREYAESTTTRGTPLFRSQLPAAWRTTMEDVVSDFRGDDLEFCRGYLAGLFDAEGTVPGGVPYIAQNDGPVVGRALQAAKTIGVEAEFKPVKGRESAGRVLLREHPVVLLPYLDIGCEEKRMAAGLRGLRKLRRTVVSVEPGPTIPLYDIQTGTENFVANGVVSHNCSWCDSMYSVDPKLVKEHAEHLTVLEIADRVKALGGQPLWVTLSGGNPAIHDLDLLTAKLQCRGFRVAVETQGSRWREWLSKVDCLTVSPKPPSSGMGDKVKVDLPKFMGEVNPTASDALKIVVFDDDDLEWATGIFETYPSWPAFLSVGTDPVTTWGSDVKVATSHAWTVEKIGERYGWLCDQVAKDPKLNRVRVLPQLHVVAYGHKRGV